MRLDLIWQIARKELLLFFASPIAYLVLSAFLAITLFVFFWGSAFFARNIADVRPMFEWLPIVLIFLASAVSMRMWSEERRSGTLEYVLTLPVSTAEFVLGEGIRVLVTYSARVGVFTPAAIAVQHQPYCGDRLGTDFCRLLGGVTVGVCLLGNWFICQRPHRQPNRKLACGRCVVWLLHMSRCTLAYRLLSSRCAKPAWRPG